MTYQSKKKLLILAALLLLYLTTLIKIKVMHKFSTGSFSDLIKTGDTDPVFDFFTNIEPTLVGGKDFSSPINSEGQHTVF
jgi:lipoprotein signal peptidase